MDETAHPSIEALLAHAGWVRKLARRLAADASAADDLAQETFATALAHEPEPGRGFASWLATTLRNLRRAERRRDDLRASIEHIGAREERVASTDELAERADLQRVLVDHVLALDEPHRSTLLLRYFAELEPRDIAQREGIPLATVTSRLTRAHAKLRERLERAHGDRRAWLSALAPLLNRPASLSTTNAGTIVTGGTLGGLLVNAKIAVAAAALILIALVAVLGLRGASPAVPEVSAPVATASATSSSTERDPELRAMDATGNEPRAPVASADSRPAASVPSEARRAQRVKGRVLGADGAPLASLWIGWAGTHDGHVRSGASGTFEIESAADEGQLDVADEDWITVRSGAWKSGTSLEPVVIAAHALDLAGTVQDESGRPLSGARVALAMPAGFGSRFDASLEGTTFHRWRTSTDASGRFSLPRSPAIDGASLNTVLEGYAAAEMSEPASSDTAIVIALARPKAPLVGALRGRVVDDHGVAVADARVFLGLASTTTDGEGRFAISLARAVSSDRITAIKAGFLPAILDRPGRPQAEKTGWPDLVELRLPGPVLSIRGVVVDTKDQPLAGVRVWIADPTPVGAIGKMPAFAENLMVGAPVPSIALETEARAPGADGDNFNDFYTPIMPSSAFWHWVLTDEEGRFELGGLDERRYRLRLMDPKSLFATTTDEIRAGTDAVRVTMPAPDLIVKIAGRVLDDDDRAVPGVQVDLESEAVGVRSRVFGGRVYVSVRHPREKVVTDAEGRFEFTGVPRTGMQLMYASEHIVPGELDLSSLKDPASCVLHVHARCSLEVVVTTKGVAADAFAVRDAEGQALDIWLIDQGSVNAYTDTGLVDGHSGVVFTSSAARTIVLLQAGAVVRTSPIRLRSDGPNRIEL